MDLKCRFWGQILNLTFAILRRFWKTENYENETETDSIFTIVVNFLVED